MGDLTNQNYMLELVEDTAILQLYNDDFSQLKKNNRLLAYFLMQAALAGRNIYYDQNHCYALEIRDILEEIITHSDDIDPELINKIVDYTKLFWVNGSHYNDRTKLKFCPKFSFEEFQSAIIKAINNGAKILSEKSNQTIDELMEKLHKVMFDTEYESLITNKSPDKEFDVITGSANNFYYGVNLSDLKNFKELYLLNSRLVKINGKIVEQVYRMGDEKNNLSSGLYAEELSSVVKNLQKAIIYASEKQQKTLLALIEYFKKGDEELFNRYNISWLADNPEVDGILGFIEVYKDARGQKGAFEGIVYCNDHKMTDLMKTIADNAQYFEDNAPWNDEYKKKHVTIPGAHAISVIFGTGYGGPTIPLGINLPNSQVLREKYGSKSVILTNVLHSINSAIGEKIVDEFILDDAKEIVREYQDIAEKLHVAMHEVLGHGSGKVNPELESDPSVYIKEYYSTIEEARADLTALYHIFDSKIIDLGLIPNQNVVYAAYWRYATSDLLSLRRIKSDSIEDDHMRATHLIVTYLIEEVKAIEPLIKDGKIYFSIVNYEQMHNGVKNLLSELMRIKAEGDYQAAKNLINRYGIKFNTSWRDQIIQRSSAIGLPNYFAFAMPTLIPIEDAKGEIIDVKVTYDDSFKTQMLKYSGKIS